MADEKKQRWLPPAVGGFNNGDVTWKRRSDRDYELLGYFLTCHLVIEHYIDETLKIEHPKLNWDDARIPFSSRLILLEKMSFAKNYDFLPSIKHMNNLRNKISHKVDYALTIQDFKPLVDFINQIPKIEKRKFETITEILDTFMSICCAYLASGIAYNARHRNLTQA